MRRHKPIAVPLGLVAAAAFGIGMVQTSPANGIASSPTTTATAAAAAAPTTIPYFKNYDELKKVSPPTGEGANYRPAGWRDSSNDATELFDAPAIEADLQARLGARYGGMWQNGLRVHFPIPNGNGLYNFCTTGWYLYSSAYGPFGTSAGHCAANGQGVTAPDNSWSGTVNNNTDGNDTSSDALVFSTATIGNYARVQNSANGHFGVMGQFSSGWPHEGEPACWTGQTTNLEACGTISATGYSVTTADGITRKNNWCVNVGSLHGDSGGPMYRYYSNGTVRAMGMVSTNVDWVGACGSHIVNILAATGLTLPTKPK